VDEVQAVGQKQEHRAGCPGKFVGARTPSSVALGLLPINHRIRMTSENKMFIKHDHPKAPSATRLIACLWGTQNSISPRAIKGLEPGLQEHY